MGTICARRTLRLVVYTMVMVAATGFSSAEEEAARDKLHGTVLSDPYRWLEGSAAPELSAEDPTLDRRVAEWTREQNARTREVLDELSGRRALEDRLRDLMEVGSVSAPTMRRNRYFYWQREGDQPQWVVYMREGHDGEPKVLIDPNELDDEGLTSIGWTSPNPDGTLLAFGVFRAGDEKTVLHVLDVDRGRWLADEIPGKVQQASWLPDSSGFIYRRLADVDNPYSGQVKFHLLGDHHRQDPVLFEQYTEGPLATTWGPYASTSRDGRWLLLMYWTGTDSNDLWAVDLNRWLRTGEFHKTEILIGEDARSFGEVIGDTLYLHTTIDAPNGRVVAVDLTDPARQSWRELVPESPTGVLENVSIGRGVIAASFLDNAVSRIEVYDLDGESLGPLDLPGIGSAELDTEADRTEAFLTFTSYNEPTSIYRVDLKSGERALWARPEIPVDPDAVEVRQVKYRSKDGTMVPMFVVHKKGLKLDGNNPTLLYGYGGFNIAMTPSFTATLFPWFEAGGVYAVANLRGGGELGDEWHRAGMLDRKQNVFDDFIAAAEYLVREGYTRPERLGITGGSNGGLLTGAALTQRPDLFAAVISSVPLLDMLRYHHFLMAKFWVPEYGSADDPEHFKVLKAYSPYHNVEADTPYPAVLLTAGENDARVHPLHARKMAARLQASTTSDPEVDPILLWVEQSAGHGAGKPLADRIRETADQRIFMMWQLGMLAGSERAEAASSTASAPAASSSSGP
ncbi:MAG: prolyl oligopeptidase family serine peptidase [Acidobacteriota bacterium]